MIKKAILILFAVLLCSATAFAQVDRREVRAGNRGFHQRGGAVQSGKRPL